MWLCPRECEPGPRLCPRLEDARPNDDERTDDTDEEVEFRPGVWARECEREREDSARVAPEPETVR